VTAPQILILIFSCLSIFLFGSKGRFRYGFILGLAGQPFWIYETLKAEQWGMFLVSLWFTANHLRGIRNNFFK